MVLEPIINMHKIKFTIMENIFKEIINIPKEKKMINIYLNLDSLLNMFYRDDVLEHIKDMNDEDRITLTAEIINIAAHYRQFFWTRMNKRVTFYFYYLSKAPKYNISLYPNYCKDKINRKKKSNIQYVPVNDLIKDNMKLLRIIIPYIPKVYLLPSNGLDPAVPVYSMIQQSNPEEDVNIIMTKDEYDFQLMSKNTLIFRMSHNKLSILSKDSLIDYILSKNKYRPACKISGKYYRNILPLISCNSRNVKSYKGMGKVSVIKKIEKNIDILNDGLGFNLFCKMLKIELTDELYDRYKIMNVKYQYKKLNSVDRLNIKENIVDKFENRTIMSINSEHFPLNPIQLIELCYGIKFYD